MRNYILISTFLILTSCKNEQTTLTKDEVVTGKETTLAYGKTLFEGEGNCVACHQVEQKIIGPSLQEIAKIYKEKNASIVLFLKQESEPIIDPSQYEIMKANFAITEEMTDEQLKALENYILSFSK